MGQLNHSVHDYQSFHIWLAISPPFLSFPFLSSQQQHCGCGSVVAIEGSCSCKNLIVLHGFTIKGSILHHKRGSFKCYLFLFFFPVFFTFDITNLIIICSWVKFCFSMTILLPKKLYANPTCLINVDVPSCMFNWLILLFLLLVVPYS